MVRAGIGKAIVALTGNRKALPPHYTMYSKVSAGLYPKSAPPRLLPHAAFFPFYQLSFICLPYLRYRYLFIYLYSSFFGSASPPFLESPETGPQPRLYLQRCLIHPPSPNRRPFELNCSIPTPTA